ncbi:DUF418 domain-containing protein [Streptomyces tubbatahanensis]|uniref:DUF418 domain-containing protein n=1 Tax=Streptomyces tubbatahanensis TaxID=2923272 RepID=A0ABY3XYM8_9ACTN|nr:DUF418 domain-containing protein [Streptomyces tubbatahanensis]UNS99456.1 DUF418 domain-containing protein [Streptomyces tubbatahanensis]
MRTQRSDRGGRGRTAVPVREAGAPLVAATSAQARRIRDVDALRGFALLGILLVNVQTMAGPYVGQEASGAVGERVAAWLVTALVSSKFYLLFAFLFGYSFTLQARSAEREGAGFAGRTLRRLLCLWCLGLAHAVLLFPGDILMTYAVLGFVLFAMRGAAPLVAVRAAVVLLVCLGVLLLGKGVLTYVTTAPGAGAAADTAGAVADYRGDPASVVHANLRQWRELLAGDLLYMPHILAAFLMGLAAGERRVLAEFDRYRGLARRVVVYGLPAGLIGGVVTAMCHNGPLDARWSGVGAAVGVFAAPVLAVAYGCGLLLLLRTRHGRRTAEVLAAAGRVALTNYLTQSLVMALVFTGYGFALYGRVGLVPVLAGCFVLCAGQLALSAWLVRRFRCGPVEWVLHTVTRGRRT